VVVSGVQRLVKITNEMEYELEGEQPLLKVGFRVLQLGKELIDLVYNARLRRAVRRQRPRCQRYSSKASRFDVGVIDFEIDEVPVLRLFVVVPAIVAVTILVCPGRFARQVVRRETVRVGIEHCTDLCPDRRVKIPLGYKRARPVSIVAPRESLVRGDHRQPNAQYLKRFHIPFPRTRRSWHPVHRAAIDTDATAPLIRERLANEKNRQTGGEQEGLSRFYHPVMTRPGERSGPKDHQPHRRDDTLDGAH
jgi:hypothetical protein